MDDDKRKAEQRAKVEGVQGSTAQKRAVWRLSSLARGDFGWLAELAPPIGPVLIFSLFTGVLYLRYYANGEQPVHGGGASGNTFVFDPKAEGYGNSLFYVFIATILLAIAGLVWVYFARRAGQRWYDEERAYAQELPFSLFGYPAVVGEHESEYAIDIYFVDQEPDREKLAGLLIDIDGFIKDTDPNRRHGQGCHFAAKYSAREPSGKNAQHFIGTVRAITGALIPIHARYPIDRVELTGLSSERSDAALAEWMSHVHD